MAETRLPEGAIIDRYRIESFLGAGGMGEVYLSHDLELGRSVALKILPERLMADPDRVRRFFTEARAASALNHPAIITIYDVGQAPVLTEMDAASSGHPVVGFMAMEAIDGETLRGHARRPSELPKALEQLARVADGLGAAHASGIVHRDLKPDNIIIDRSGAPKILDFGIAKLLEPRAGEQDSGDENTAPTSLLGTAGYMSPEQIQGGPVDQRSDIFSFGCVLYEVITGQQPFRGHSVVDTMHRIAYEEFVPAAQINPVVSRDLQRVVRKCLQKDPEARYQSIRDAAIDLREVALEQKSGSIPGVERPRNTAMRTLSWSVAAVAMMIAVLLTYPIFRQSSVKAAERADQPQKESAWPIELSRVTNTGNAGPAAISDDGRYVAHVRSDGDKQSLWIKQVATGSFIQVVSPIRASYTWVVLSPDGDYIYFSRADFPEFNIQNLFKVPILGGEVRKLIANVDGCAALSPDGERLSFARFDAVQRDRVLYVADADGTDERVVIKRRFPDFFTWSVAWSPEGKRLALLMGRESTTPVVESGDDGPEGRLHMVEVDVQSGALRPLFSRGFPGVASLVWLRDDTGFLVAIGGKQPPQIWFVPYPEGQPRKLTNDLTAYGQITATADSKTVVALRGEMTTNLWIVDRDDPRHPRAITKGANLYGLDGAPRWLPDGNIITPQFDGRANLKVLSPDGQILRSTTEAWDQANPVISADGTRMVYLSNRSGPTEVWVSSLDGSDARQVTHAGRVHFVSMMTDGQSVIYNTSGEDQFAWRVSIDGGRLVRITDKPTSRRSVATATPNRASHCGERR